MGNRLEMKGQPISKSKVTLHGIVMWVADVPIPMGSPRSRLPPRPACSVTWFRCKWKAGTPQGASATLKITMQGTDGMTIEVPEYQLKVKGSFDGHDHPVMQAGQASITDTFAKRGTNSFKITTKLNGKPFAVDVYTLSADGKTLTDESTAIATSETTKAVSERQDRCSRASSPSGWSIPSRRSRSRRDSPLQRASYTRADQLTRRNREPGGYEHAGGGL